MKKILFPARGLNRDRGIPLLRLRAELRGLNGLSPFKFSCLSATERRSTAAGRATVVCGFFPHKKKVGRIETRTRDKKYLGWMRSV